MKNVSKQEAVNLLFALYNIKSPRIFTVIFEYRDSPSNRKLKRVGQTRTLTGAFHIEAYNVGKAPAYDPNEKKLFWVVDMGVINKHKHLPQEKRPNPHRSIPWEGIRTIKMEKEVFVVV